MGKFELINVKSGKRYGINEVVISKDKRNMRIGRIVAEQLNWKDGERVNLYFDGETFKLEPDKVGLVTIKKRSDFFGVTGQNFCIEILYRARNCFRYEATVKDNVLYFKPKKEEEL